MNSIKIKNVKRAFDKFLMDIPDLNIPSGCIVGVVGENGSGKTTLLKMIAGIQKIDSGNISLFETDLEKRKPEDLQKIGIIFEDIHFPPNMKISQIAKYCSMSFVQWDSNKFDRLLNQFQISKDSKASALSKGMRAKLFFAVALCHHPQLLLLDETLSGLDPIAKDRVLKILSEFIEDEKNTVLISSNVVSDFEKNTDYILYLSDGKIRFFESIEHLRENYMICDYDDLISILKYDAIPKKCDTVMEQCDISSKDCDMSFDSCDTYNIKDRQCIKGIQKNDFSKDVLVDISKINRNIKFPMRKATIEEIVMFMGGDEEDEKPFV